VSVVFRSLFVISLALTPFFFSLFCRPHLLDIIPQQQPGLSAVLGSGIGIKKAEAHYAYRDANGHF